MISNSKSKSKVKVKVKVMIKIYPNQLESATRICKHFEHGHSQVLLVSQTQAGKTGTAVETIRQSIEKLDYRRDQVYFICGINDNSLKEQAVNDFKLSGVLDSSNVLFSKDIESMFNNACIPEPELDLVVIDECHYANRICSLIDKFLKKTSPKHILSISATPMAETVWFKSKGMAIEYLKPGQNYTGLIELYQSGRIRQSYQLSQEESIEADPDSSDDACELSGRVGFIDFICEQYDNQVTNPLYNIVRLPELFYGTDLERELLDMDMDIDFINLHSQLQSWGTGVSSRAPTAYEIQSQISNMEGVMGDTLSPSQSQIHNTEGVQLDTLSPSQSHNTEGVQLDTLSPNRIPDINNYIENKPVKMTIIWIYGSMRAGKRLNTRWLGFVHDTARTKPDCTTQGLLGRITGYNRDDSNVCCYTDLNSAKLMYNWIINEYDSRYIPRGSTNIKFGFSLNQAHSKWNYNPPFHFYLDTEVADYFRQLKLTNTSRKYLFRQELFEYLDRQDKDSQITRLWRMVRHKYRRGKNGGLSILTEFSAKRTYHEHFCLKYKASLEGKPIRGFDVSKSRPDNYYHIFIDLSQNSDTYGCVVCVYKEFIGYGTTYRPALNTRLSDKCRLK